MKTLKPYKEIRARKVNEIQNKMNVKGNCVYVSF